MKNSMHHNAPHAPHAPPNITMHHIYIYLVGLPSTLYEIPCQCDRFDVKQLILRISCEIHNEIRSVSFCVMIKYRSFEKRKTKHSSVTEIAYFIKSLSARGLPYWMQSGRGGHFYLAQVIITPA